jgi:hypothetical protein
MTDTNCTMETMKCDNTIIDYYTMVLLADIQRGSSTIKLSSVEGVYKGRVLYTSDMDDFFTILSVNYDTNTVTIDGSFDYNGQRRIVTVE